MILLKFILLFYFKLFSLRFFVIKNKIIINSLLPRLLPLPKYSPIINVDDGGANDESFNCH